MGTFTSSNEICAYLAYRRPLSGNRFRAITEVAVLRLPPLETYPVSLIDPQRSDAPVSFPASGSGYQRCDPRDRKRAHDMRG